MTPEGSEVVSRAERCVSTCPMPHQWSVPTRSVPTRSLPPLILSADPDGTSGETDRSGGCCRFTADIRPLQMERRECGTAGRGDSSLPQHIKQLHQHIHLLCVFIRPPVCVCVSPAASLSNYLSVSRCLRVPSCLYLLLWCCTSPAGANFIFTSSARRRESHIPKGSSSKLLCLLLQSHR